MIQCMLRFIVDRLTKNCDPGFYSMNTRLNNSVESKDKRCMICGRIHETGVYENSSEILQPQIEMGFCYVIYKRLLGIYGAPYVAILNSC